MIGKNEDYKYSKVIKINANCEKTSASVYPNPAFSKVIVKGLTGVTTIKLINVAGQVLKTIKVVQPSMVIDISNLHETVYFMQLLKDGELKQSFPIMKK